MSALLRSGIYLLTLAVFILALAYEHGMVMAGVAPEFVSNVLAPRLAWGACLPFVVGIVFIIAGVFEFAFSKKTMLSSLAESITLFLTLAMFALFCYYAWSFYVV